MDVFHSVWADVVTGAIALKDKLPTDKLPSKMFSQIISKRSVETLVARSDSGVDAGKIAFVVAVVINCVIAFGILLFISYTLNSVFPVLSIVEDDDGPPAYESVSFKDELDGESAKYMAGTPGDEESPVQQWRPATSSLRSTYRVLSASRGWRGVWRGLEYAFVHSILLGLIASIFRALPFGLDVVGFAVASLLTVQFGVAWTHEVISDSSRNSFWQRLPSFGLAFRATALPTLVVMLVSSLTHMIPAGVRLISNNDILKALLTLGLLITYYVFIVIPTTVVLVRVRASLLPEGDQVLVPFDKALTLHRAYGKEYMTMIDAWKSFSRTAWIRLVKLYVKVFAVSILAFLAMASIVGGEFLIVQLFSRNN